MPKYDEEGFQVDDTTGERMIDDTTGEYIMNPDASQGDEEVEIGGVTYTLDTDGNYCLSGIPVLGADKVPFHNRAREIDKKEVKHKQEIATLNTTHQQEITTLTANRQPNPSRDPDDIDEATGLKNKEVDALERRFLDNLNRDGRTKQARTDNMLANNNVDLQLIKLKQSPKHKGFFSNAEYAKELGEQLDALTLQDAMLPGVVAQVLKGVIGNHHEEITKKVAADTRKKTLENREIVGEVELGSSAGPRTGKSVVITDEMRQLATDSKMSIETAAAVITDRNERRAKQKEDKK